MSQALPTSRSSAPHYQWGDGCDGWHLVKSAGLSVIEEHMPPGTREVRHRHAHARQFFFVLRGTLTIDVEGGAHVLRGHQGIEVAPGCAHEVRNDDAAAGVDFLVISQPPSQGDRVAAPVGA